MAAVGRTDEMIRDYLLFRGFTSTLKAFDTDLKNEREKGFRVRNTNDVFVEYKPSILAIQSTFERTIT